MPHPSDRDLALAPQRGERERASFGAVEGEGCESK
jgi:hypothetical protein